MRTHAAPLFLGVLLLAANTSLLAQAGTKAAAPDLSDAEVAHVAVTANTIDAELGRYAESRASRAEVKQFARAMIEAHTAVNEQAAELAQRLAVTPSDNAVSKSLQQAAADARALLEKADAAGFDRAYMHREVAYHQAVLDALDGLLIPTTQNAELKALLEQVRPAIAAHLAHARQIRSSIDRGQ